MNRANSAACVLCGRLLSDLDADTPSGRGRWRDRHGRCELKRRAQAAKARREAIRLWDGIEPGRRVTVGHYTITRKEVSVPGPYRKAKSCFTCTKPFVGGSGAEECRDCTAKRQREKKARWHVAHRAARLAYMKRWYREHGGAARSRKDYYRLADARGVVARKRKGVA